ncbi:bcl-2 homologous antagonist/killer isoform X2 [Octodon degus]|uniref:Bcl-2 homologous antagonist/killer n=1 Tax=Octodon degus TaxID=10160 RepID=A0A6P6EWF7_OCTDE|nr:bcl-2 homologous antagonist/killer isoform X2 [Octodon degus]
MASDQGPGPPDDEGCSEASSLSEKEQQVARDTEEVFRSYVYYRHQQEQQQQQQEQEGEGAAVSTDPEMDTLPLDPSSTLAQVGRQLSVIGDDINRRYNSEFQSLLQQLQPTADNAYDLFLKIASSLFKSGINWGRVAALLAFGYRLALHVYRQGLSGFLGKVTRLVINCMLHYCIVHWIAKEGGWEKAVRWVNDPILIVGAILGLVLVGEYVVRRFFKSS